MTWSPAKLFAFRFGFAYVVLYVTPQPLHALPLFASLTEKYTALYSRAAAWLGELVLGVVADPATPFNGSGDRTLDYLALFFTLVVSFVIATAWTLIDRRRATPSVDHDRLARGVWIWLRYVMAYTMIGYGFAKLWWSQFPPPSPARLAQPLGEMTPMGLLWTFMGHSFAYNVLTGTVEVLGGLLVLWRRTTTLGALVIAGAMVNIVALNFCYDVPVKLFSTHLLVFAVVLAAPDLGRLANVLVLGRATTPPPPPAPLRNVWLRRGRVIAKIAFIAWAFYDNYSMSTQSPRMATTAANDLFRASFTVESQTGVTKRWLALDGGRSGYVFVRRDDDTVARYGIDVHTIPRRLLFTTADAKVGAPVDAYSPTYSFVGPDRVVLEGPFEGANVRIVLVRRQWRLASTGFHWVNEFPNNR